MRARRVMRCQHARRQRLIGIAIGVVRRLRQRPAQHPLDLAARHAAGPQQHRRVETSDNGGFDADLDRAAIDDEVDSPRKIAPHMRGRGRRDMPGEIGRWRHHRAAEGAQDLARYRVRGNPDRDGVEPGGGKIGHRAAGRLRQHQRQRPRPERLRKQDGLRVETRDPLRRFEVADMGDQRIERGPALGLIQPRNRRRIGGVGAEPIDRLGRERDQPAVRRQRAASATAASFAARIGVVRPTFMGFASSIHRLAVCETQGYKPRSCRSVAQPGRALRSGRRGRRFKSCHSDHYINGFGYVLARPLLTKNLPFARKMQAAFLRRARSGRDAANSQQGALTCQSANR